MKVGPLSNFMNQVRDEPAWPRSTPPWWSAWRVPLQLPLVVDAETMLQVRIRDLGLSRQRICLTCINRDLSVHGTFINNVSNDRLDLPLLKGMGELGEWWRQVFCRSLFVCASPRSTHRTSRNTGKEILWIWMNKKSVMNLWIDIFSSPVSSLIRHIRNRVEHTD